MMSTWLPSTMLALACLLMACGDPPKPETAQFPAKPAVAAPKPTPKAPDGCEKGDAEVCAALAAKRGTAGLPLHERACDLGRGESCYVIALVRDETGAPVAGAPKDAALATHFYAVGCELGYPDACGPASKRLRDGTGAPANPARAAVMDRRAIDDYERQCDSGDAEACRSAGLLHAMGRGAPRNDNVANALGQRAFNFFKAGCDRSVPAACRQLASCYHLGGCGDLDADKPRAIALYKLACEQGDAAACRLGEMVR